MNILFFESYHIGLHDDWIYIPPSPTAFKSSFLSTSSTHIVSHNMICGYFHCCMRYFIDLICFFLIDYEHLFHVHGVNLCSLFLSIYSNLMSEAWDITADRVLSLYSTNLGWLHPSLHMIHWGPPSRDP